MADVSDHDQSGTLASKTISQKYQELVGAALNTAYQATYAQNGSTVIGMQAHSTTPLGVAIGTNALVRKEPMVPRLLDLVLLYKQMRKLQ